MIILGIDPGTRTTGYGIIRDEDGKISCIEYGAIKNPQKLNAWECQLRIFDGISKIVQEYAIDAVAVESQFFYKNARTALRIGEARSVALLSATRAGIPIFEYAPKRVKQAVSGTGTARKEQVQLMVGVLLNISGKITPEDAADALGIAITHVHARKVSAMIEGNISTATKPR